MTTPVKQAAPLTNLLSIDVEDYFQVSAFEKVSPPASWEEREWRFEANTERVLGLLEEQGIYATFFVLSWVAERCPALIQRLVSAGHELASHGHGHRRINTLSRDEFRADIRHAKDQLEQTSGTEVLGYRAPSYSISQKTSWAFDELIEAGYRYDSSIFPMRHDFYGMADWSRFAGFAVKDEQGTWQDGEPTAGQASLRELPISTLRLAGKNLPIAGGGYFRLLPYCVTRWGLQRINQQDGQPFVFYLHPWEFDPHQPRMQGAGWKSNFRHYLNLNKTQPRFKKLLEDFHFSTIRDGLGLAEAK
ncbi:XrtA system polysaccharide deacetylase [uncultured Desulfuromonas sp.]|uniref:XrtA system polysaccharide deacetylase n=1 Tax=uncultured Desulfuromonas sp. TaxID=181013 RepID=UPI002AAB5C2E|nr:XrtA system polysaccharide deacetylase [uncultured Desulfuromonas sp.]